MPVKRISRHTCHFQHIAMSDYRPNSTACLLRRRPSPTWGRSECIESKDQIVAKQKYITYVDTRKRGTTMPYTRPTALFTIAAFLLGFGLGGASIHYASAEGFFGVTPSFNRMG